MNTRCPRETERSAIVILFIHLFILCVCVCVCVCGGGGGGAGVFDFSLRQGLMLTNVADKWVNTIACDASVYSTARS